MDFSSLNPITSNALNLAARKNDFKAVGRLLKKMNPNCIDNRGWTCLHEAAANDSYESLMLILNHPDCRPLAEDHEGHTALYLACRHHCSIQTIKALLESEEDLANYSSTECVTPLHIASAQGRIDLIQLLIEYGAMIDVQDFDGDTSLHDAALGSQHESVEMLLHAGADPEIKNENNYTPFHLACLKGCYQTIQHLFPFVININQITLNGDTPLMLATQGCNHDIVKFLLENGANPHIKNIEGESALFMALNRGYSEIFVTLLSITKEENIIPDIILLACKPHYFKMEILGNLLNQDLGPQFFDFFEPFHVTLEQIGDIRPKYLTNAPLNSYLNICEYIYNRSTENFREFFYLFLMKGLDVNAINIDECPPLVYIHYCAHSACFEEVFEILKNHNCDIDYCTVPSSRRQNYSFPDAFIASLTSDPTTTPMMLPYSLHCEPGEFIQFAAENGVLSRIPLYVQYQLLSVMDYKTDGVTVEALSYFVPSLKHLSRLSVRKILKGCGVISTKQFLDAIKCLGLPEMMQNYLRYL